MTSVLVVGNGAVGRRVADHLRVSVAVHEVLVQSSTDPAISRDVDVVVLATPPGHVDAATEALRRGAHVVSLSDAVSDAESLVALGVAASGADRRVVLGAGFAPGLTCVLARHAASEFNAVDEVHVAKTGTGGPACARQHHAALSEDGLDWRDGHWEAFPGGSGRELCWFPEPIGGVDCYRAALADPLLLQPVFADARWITSRVGATRRDRATARLPMLRRPHAEAGEGAVRVEVRGRRAGQVDSVVLGCTARPSVAAAAVVAVMVDELLAGRCVGPNVGGLASQVGDPVAVLEALARLNVRCARFDGAAVGGR
jgi:hypothetical protein